VGSRAEVILDGRAQSTQASEDMVWVEGKKNGERRKFRSWVREDWRSPRS